MAVGRVSDGRVSDGRVSDGRVSDGRISGAQALEACTLLRDGFGAEDIAIRLGVAAGAVRDLVAALRARGLLAEVLGLAGRRRGRG